MITIKILKAIVNPIIWFFTDSDNKEGLTEKEINSRSFYIIFFAVIAIFIFNAAMPISVWLIPVFFIAMAIEGIIVFWRNIRKNIRNNAREKKIKDDEEEILFLERQAALDERREDLRGFANKKSFKDVFDD